MSDIKALAFSGSTRKDSWNGKLINEVAHLAEEKGITVTRLHLNDYPLPIYNGDLEERDGLPTTAIELQNLFNAHNILLIATPEYNGFFPALLKNTLDWTSRPTDTQGASASFTGKPVGLFAASPGRLGGIRALGHLRSQMADLGAIVSGTGVSVGEAHNAFDANGKLTSEPLIDMIDSQLAALMTQTA